MTRRMAIGSMVTKMAPSMEPSTEPSPPMMIMAR